MISSEVKAGCALEAALGPGTVPLSNPVVPCSVHAVEADSSHSSRFTVVRLHYTQERGIQEAAGTAAVKVL